MSTDTYFRPAPLAHPDDVSEEEERTDQDMDPVLAKRLKFYRKIIPNHDLYTDDEILATPMDIIWRLQRDQEEGQGVRTCARVHEAGNQNEARIRGYEGQSGVLA
jgi:hypothetical protein